MELNKILNRANEENVSKDDSFIKYAFYSIDYSDIDKILFTRYISTDEDVKLQEFLNTNKDLTKLDDKQIRKAFELNKPKTDWERFFGNKKIDDNFQQILNNIRQFRNSIAHCKFFSKSQYTECLQLLEQQTKSLDIAISITEGRDFLQKKIELQLESTNRILKMLCEIVVRDYSPIMDSIELIAQPIRELNDGKVNLIGKQLPSIIDFIPNNILTNELFKYNFQKENENTTKKLNIDNE